MSLTVEDVANKEENMKNFYISYERDGVYQALIIKANSEEEASTCMWMRKPDAVVLRITEKDDISTEMRKGMPIITA